MLMNVLMELTLVMQQHKNVKTLLVAFHVNVKLDFEGVPILMNVHLKQIHVTSSPITPTLMVDLKVVALMVTAEIASR